MANFYCDHGAYASALGATPTWGVPQEGDGSSKDAATASSVASILLNAQPAAGNLLSICGITFGATSGGTVNYTIGGTLTATVDNIVAAINGCTTAVGASVAGGTPQLRNLVFARNTGGTTVQIMMRVGSAALDYANNTSVGITSSGWGTAPTITHFAGGSGGCWGWLANTAAIGVSSSIAALAYGLITGTQPMVSSLGTTLQVPTITDPVYVRTGNGYTLTCAVNTSPNLGAVTFSRWLVFDTNTQWTGDSGNGKVVISMSTNNADIALRLVANAAYTLRYTALKKGGFKFLWASSNTSGYLYFHPTSTGGNRAISLFENIAFEEGAGVSASVSNMRIIVSGGYAATRFKGCTFNYTTGRTAWWGLVTAYSGYDGSLIFEGCTVTANLTAGADPGAVFSVGLSTGAALRVIGCDFSGWAFGKLRALSSGLTMGSGIEYLFSGNTGLAMGTSYLNASAQDSWNPNRITSSFSSQDTGFAFRYEYMAGVVDWNPDASPAYPTRGALLFDGVTPWSIKMDWFANTANVFSNLVTPEMSTVYRQAAATKTISIDFLSPIALTEFDIVLRVQYVGTNGKVVSETTLGNAAALTSPGATWTGISNYPSHTSKRLSLTTQNAIKQGTIVSAFIEIMRVPPGGSGVQLYVDPEMAIT